MIDYENRPPGTGKTTFLVSVIAQCLLNSSQATGDDSNENVHNKTRRKPRRRILVTAPTNKAITVLVTRFLDAINHCGSNDKNNNNTLPFNVAMIGVEDKLVSEGEEGNDGPGAAAPLGNNKNVVDDPFTISSLPSPLRRIFVYTWMQSIVNDFKALRHDLHVYLSSSFSNYECGGGGLATTLTLLITRARQLKQKLIQSIPSLSKSSGATELSKEFVRLLEAAIIAEHCNETERQQTKSFWTEAMHSLDYLIEALISIDKGTATHELLATADVIFCTLSTAGVSVMKRTKRIDDLFVDEAAAATEPEIAIPFHLGPDRMLAVGDPNQLPACVMSKHAMDMGLDKSMHARLMFDCGKDHIMLDVQYRMNPEIASFPSFRFYNSKIANGGNVVRYEYLSFSYQMFLLLLY